MGLAEPELAQPHAETVEMSWGHLHDGGEFSRAMVKGNLPGLAKRSFRRLDEPMPKRPARAAKGPKPAL
jgi:hypothetical protein